MHQWKIAVISYCNKRAIAIIIVTWFLVELMYVWKFGFNFRMESLKYINEAHFILKNHHFSQARYLFYLSTILIIALSFLLKVGLYGAVTIIMLVNLSSYFYFHKALKHIFPGSIKPLFICLFLISFWPYQLWSAFLYTECIFYSMVILLFSRLLLFKKMDARFLVTTSIILLGVIISRPLGMLFVTPVLGFIYFNLARKQKIFFYFILLLSFILINKIVEIVFTTTSDWNMQRPFLEESIICDMPVSVVDKNIVISHNPNPLYQLFFYITHNFSIFLRLAFIRLRYFFFMVRDYYSWAHNIYLIVYLSFLYGCIILKFKTIRERLPIPLLVFIFFSIFFFALAVVFQCDDYHNRFFLTLIPLLVVLAIAGKAGEKAGTQHFLN